MEGKLNTFLLLYLIGNLKGAKISLKTLWENVSANPSHLLDRPLLLRMIPSWPKLFAL